MSTCEDMFLPILMLSHSHMIVHAYLLLMTHMIEF
jgi:hypothetical protein